MLYDSLWLASCWQVDSLLPLLVAHVMFILRYCHAAQGWCISVRSLILLLNLGTPRLSETAAIWTLNADGVPASVQMDAMRSILVEPTGPADRISTASWVNGTARACLGLSGSISMPLGKTRDPATAESSRFVPQERAL